MKSGKDFHGSVDFVDFGDFGWIWEGFPDPCILEDFGWIHGICLPVRSPIRQPVRPPLALVETNKGTTGLGKKETD